MADRVLSPTGMQVLCAAGAFMATVEMVTSTGSEVLFFLAVWVSSLGLFAAFHREQDVDDGHLFPEDIPCLECEMRFGRGRRRTM